MRILIANNNQAKRANLVELVQNCGHEPIESLLAQELIATFRENTPELCFVDGTESLKTTLTLVKQIRQLGGMSTWSPIVLLHNDCRDEQLKDILEAGIDDIVPADMDSRQLHIKIHAAKRQEQLRQRVFSVAHNLAQGSRALENLVVQDALTGLPNSNSFEMRLENQWYDARRTKKPFSLLIMNLDFFQAYNDCYGAKAGDKTIQQVVRVVRQNLPSETCFFARIRGVTFGLLLPECDESKAKTLADSIEKEINQANIPHARSGCGDKITLSIGIVTMQDPNQSSLKGPWELLEAADFALYEAKHRGRNQIYLGQVS